MNELSSLLPRQPVRLAIRLLAQSGMDDAGFLDVVQSLAFEPFSAVLLSGGHLDCARYSIAGWDPFLVFKSKGRMVEWGVPGSQVVYDDEVHHE